MQPGIQLLLSGCIAFILGMLFYGLATYYGTVEYISDAFCHTLFSTGHLLTSIGISLSIVGVIVYWKTPTEHKLKCMVERRLCSSRFGNPLNLNNGEICPKITVSKDRLSLKYIIKIHANSRTVLDLIDTLPAISSSLTGSFENYAVVWTDTDIASNSVSFIIDDVTQSKKIIIHDIEELNTTDVTKIRIQKGTYIDLTTSGSMLVAGKTRSGKTSAIISILLQILKNGRDHYHSSVIIIDPKIAELSMLPYTVAPEPNGNAMCIISALKDFADSIIYRQQVLNNISLKTGTAVHWWDAGFFPSIIFIDEWVALRTLFPKRAEKDNPDYCITVFDDLVKRIVTMGASTGSYMIISTAEASVEEAGIPAMIRSAMTTKILLKPTIQEGTLLWDSQKLKTIPERIYQPGDAWFSSTDGIHENITFVQFPDLQFNVYQELGNLLVDYHRM